MRNGQLEQEQNFVSMAVERTAEMIVITDSEGIICYVNSAFEQITGYTKVEVIGQNPRILKSGKQGADFYAEMWQTIKAGQVWQGYFTNRKKDGSLYKEYANITPVFNRDDQIVNFVAVKRDVTWEMHREEQYRQAQKMEAIGRLAGGVAHDFNNHLTIITGYTELLLERYAGSDDALIRDLEQMNKAIKRASQLTRQLLAFSRKEKVQLRQLDLNEIITNISQMLQRLIGEDISLKTLLSQDLAQIKADPSQIEQILVNLVVNSRDAMPHGGSIYLETANIYLDTSFTSKEVDIEPGWYVMLAVTDTGAGMDEETQAKVFEPFFTTKDKSAGTGLGLSIVYSIVKQYGGHIRVSSELKQGTSFKLYFPRIAAPVKSNHKPAVSVPAQSGSETILLVEDDATVRQLVCRVLALNGYTVLDVADGREAVQLCQHYRKPIHLLLTDVVMPGGMNGFQLMDCLIKICPDMKVLIMSGYPEYKIGYRNKLMDTAFLQKPFSPNRLAHKVREILHG